MNTTADRQPGSWAQKTLADRYRLVGLMTVDPWGETYAAEADGHVAGQVVVKVYGASVGRNKNQRKAFGRDLKALRSIAGGDLQRCLDFELEGEVRWAAFEGAPSGLSLRELLAARGPAPREVGLRLAWRLAQALSALHGARALHRNFGAHAVFLDGLELSAGWQVGDAAAPLRVVGAGEWELVAVKDPVAAWQADRSVFLGHGDYMAPEQVEGEFVDDRTDLYALGLLIHELLTGKPPFASESLATTLKRQIYEETPPVHLSNGSTALSEDEQEIILTACAKDRDERFATASALAGALAGLGYAVSEDALSQAAALLAARRRAPEPEPTPEPTPEPEPPAAVEPEPPATSAAEPAPVEPAPVEPAPASVAAAPAGLADVMDVEGGWDLELPGGDLPSKAAPAALPTAEPAPEASAPASGAAPKRTLLGMAVDPETLQQMAARAAAPGGTDTLAAVAAAAAAAPTTFDPASGAAAAAPVTPDPAAAPSEGAAAADADASAAASEEAPSAAEGPKEPDAAVATSGDAAGATDDAVAAPSGGPVDAEAPQAALPAASTPTAAPASPEQSKGGGDDKKGGGRGKKKKKGRDRGGRRGGEGEAGDDGDAGTSAEGLPSIMVDMKALTGEHQAVDPMLVPPPERKPTDTTRLGAESVPAAAPAPSKPAPIPTPVSAPRPAPVAPRKASPELEIEEAPAPEAEAWFAWNAEQAEETPPDTPFGARNNIILIAVAAVLLLLGVGGIYALASSSSEEETPPNTEASLRDLEARNAARRKETLEDFRQAMERGELTPPGEDTAFRHLLHLRTLSGGSVSAEYDEASRLFVDKASQKMRQEAQLPGGGAAQDIASFILQIDKENTEAKKIRAGVGIAPPEVEADADEAGADDEADAAVEAPPDAAEADAAEEIDAAPAEAPVEDKAPGEPPTEDKAPPVELPPVSAPASAPVSAPTPPSTEASTPPEGPQDKAARQQQVERLLREAGQARGQLAVAKYREVLKLDPANHRAHFQVGLLLSQDGDYTTALPSLERAVRFSGRNAQYRLYLGNAYLKVGRGDDARKQYQEVLKLDPNNTVARKMLEKLP